ncbi:MAG: helix-turn-helix domain-containing protein [Roseomonas sp.]|nr:helix-turn-helix domain-containing protein [Roseomonas sp.]
MAPLLGVSARKVQQLCQAGDLPANKVGAVWTIRADDVHEYLRRTSNAPKPRCPPISIAVATPGGRASRLPDATTAKAYARLIGQKPAAG